LKDPYPFRFNQLEDGQKSNDDYSARGLFGEEEMKRKAPLLLLKKEKNLLNLILDAESIQGHFMEGFLRCP
jgi:hypothetical protein